MSSTDSTLPATSSDQPSPRASTDKRPRRYGYCKPQSQPFSESAQKRSSVTSLGKIDHLQHRFARGPVLTGRCKPTIRGSRRTMDSSETTITTRNEGSCETVSEDCDEFSEDDSDPIAIPLPPSPLPKKFYRSVSDDVDHSKMQLTLLSQLRHAKSILITLESETGLADTSRETIMSIANTISRCISLARRYSTTVPSYRSIATTYSVFREDAIEVRSQLENILQREGAGGFTQHEHSTIVTWLANIESYLAEEQKQFDCQTVDWLHDLLWKDREEDRHRAFLKFYSPPSDRVALKMDEANSLQELSTGVILCSTFNAVVLRSKKPFGLILRYHEDVSIRYRVLENLRFWKTALSYRFDIELEHFDVHEVFAMSEMGLNQLREATRLFCRVAIMELKLTVQANAQHNHEEDTLKEVKRLSIGCPQAA